MSFFTKNKEGLKKVQANNVKATEALEQTKVITNAWDAKGS